MYNNEQLIAKLEGKSLVYIPTPRASQFQLEIYAPGFLGSEACMEIGDRHLAAWPGP